MRLPDDLAEFLQIDIKCDDSVDLIFQPLIIYMNMIREEKFNYDQAFHLPGVIDKFISLLSFYGQETSNLSEATNEFMEILGRVSNFKGTKYVEKTTSVLRRLFDKNKAPKYRPEITIITQVEADIRVKLGKCFQLLYDKVIKYYNEFKNNYQKEVNLDGFFNPDNSNLEDAKKLINQAIKIIESSDKISDKAKKSILNHIKKALNEIDKPKPNWTITFGRIKETIIILGAIGSLAGGIYGGISGHIAMNQAKGKLEEAEKIIEKTSINLNHKNIKSIFNDSLKIEQKPLKLLLEKKEESENAK